MLSYHYLKGCSSTLLSFRISRDRGFHIAYSLDLSLFVCLFGWLFFGDAIVELLIQTIVEVVVFHVVNFQLAIRILSVWCYVHALVLTHNTVVSDYCIAVPNKFLTYLVNKRNFYSFGRYLKSSALCQFRLVVYKDRTASA